MTKYNNFKVETDADGIALVTWDMPGKSMNVFTEEVMDELEKIVDRVAGDAAIKGAVITSGKDSFSGGADLTMLQKMLGIFKKERSKNPEAAVKMLFDGAGRMTWLFRKLETSGKPWVSAINGTCMGGAFELSLACHGRVAADSDKVKMALPEVKVGIFPGAGGTQRVPRLAKGQDALQMLTSGQNLSPQKAKAMGLIHEIAEPAKLVETAKAMIRNGLDPVAPWDKKGFKLPEGPVYSAAGANLWPPAIAILRRETYGNYPAASAILKCVYEGLLVPFDTGLRIEQRYFAHVLQSREAEAMVRSLFVSLQELNKGARRPEGVAETKFKKIGVVGAGFMGAGIAYVTAKAGIPVVLVDRDQEAADKGKAHSAGLMDGLVKKGRATAEEKEKLLSLITATPDYAALEGCDLVIEAVFEDRAIKADVTKKAEAVLAADKVFASNTSTLPITGLAQASARPANFIGLHFFSPVDKMPLVEIIVGKATGDETLARAFDYVLQIGKTPIVVNDSRGFYTSRVFATYVMEGIAMLKEGVHPRSIEVAGLQAGMPMPPLALQDEVSLSLSVHVAEQTKKDLAAEGKTLPEHPGYAVIRHLVEIGRIGKKAGKGFYDYTDAGKTLWPELTKLYPTAAEQPAQRELIDRLMFAQANEAARCHEEKVLRSAADGNIGSIFGWGFAPFQGGALRFIDSMGAKAFVARARELAAKYGPRFEPAAVVVKMAETGGRFGDS